MYTVKNSTHEPETFHIITNVHHHVFQTFSPLKTFHASTKTQTHLNDDALAPVLLLKATREEIHKGLHTHTHGGESEIYMSFYKMLVC